MDVVCGGSSEVAHYLLASSLQRPRVRKVTETHSQVEIRERGSDRVVTAFL